MKKDFNDLSGRKSFDINMLYGSLWFGIVGSIGLKGNWFVAFASCFACAWHLAARSSFSRLGSREDQALKAPKMSKMGEKSEKLFRPLEDCRQFLAGGRENDKVDL